MSLYHKQAYGLPKIPIAPITQLVLSQHVKNAVETRKIKLDLTAFDPTRWNIFELELDDKNQLVKLAARKRYDQWYDIVVVLDVQTKVVKTAWLNRNGDRHHTVDRAAYARP